MQPFGDKSPTMIRLLKTGTTDPVSARKLAHSTSIDIPNNSFNVEKDNSAR